MLTCGQQRVLLALDEAAVLLGCPSVLLFADGVQSVTEMTHHVELVVDDADMGGVLSKGDPERRPHILNGDLEASDRSWSALLQEGEELRHALGGTILAADPDRALPLQITNDDSVPMALLHRDLVDSD